nr:MAPEG family protein [uncultured Undibacterium sp.]
MYILPIYAALCGVLFFYLSVRTIGLRRKLKIGIGTSDNQEMLRAMRVHSNFAEYVPIVLFLIYFVEVQGGARLLIHALGLCLLFGRCLHAYGVSQLKEKFVFRVTGMAMTFTAMLSSCLFLIYKYFAV